MKEHPILFSAPMVRAILAGSKTVTRREVKPQPDFVFDGLAARSTPDDMRLGRLGQVIRCPYGQPGDRLYVKEAWRTSSDIDELSGSAIAERCLDAGYRKPWASIRYEADGQCVNWNTRVGASPENVAGRYRHARFMPRWASRITLEITAVRVERLQDISEAAALAEGVDAAPDFRHALNHPEAMSFRAGFAQLWDQLNGHDLDVLDDDGHKIGTRPNPGRWDANPWVWAIEFRRVMP